MNPSSTRRWLIAGLVALGMLTASGVYAQTDDITPPTVTSVGYYADEEATIPITAAFRDTNIYMIIRFSENVTNRDTVFAAPGSPGDFVEGRPRIAVQHRSFLGLGNTFMAIIEHDTAFPDDGDRCRAESEDDTSEYLCRVLLQTGQFFLGPLQVRLPAGETSDLEGNTLVEQYLDEPGITVVETTAVMPSVTSVSHYSDADRTTTISGTVEDGAIYSVIQFSAGLAIGAKLADPPNRNADARPQIFYQIGTATTRVQFGGHDTTGTPQNETCALLDSGTTTLTNQPFWCRYNTRSDDEGTYKIIVGTSTADIAGQTLATEYTDATGVELDVTAGTATLRIANVSVNESSGMATVTVMVNEAISGGFSVDAMTTTGGSATAGEDYTATTETLAFDGDANETQTFTVTILDDTIYEGGESGTAETVMVSLDNLVLPPGAPTVDYSATASIRITDNDYEVVLTITDVIVREGGTGTTASGTVTLNAAVPDNFSVDISTADGSAIAGEDYTATTQTLNFVGIAGEPQTFSVPITNDTTPEFPETLTVSLSNLQVPMDTATRVGILRPAIATITIRDNDSSGIDLNLLFPVTGNGKTYYYLNNSGNGIADFGSFAGPDNGDRVTHSALDNLLNDRDDTVNTQTDRPGGHDGSDDARSVIIGNTAVILPTPAEFQALRAVTSATPAGWWSGVDNNYWTSNRTESNKHSHYKFPTDTVADTFGTDGDLNFVAFQVLTFLTFEGVITDQFYNVSRTVTVTLPEATGGLGDLSYTLTEDLLPDGLTFNGNARPPTLTGTPIAMADPVTLTYTVIDSAPPMSTAELTFMVTVNPQEDLSFASTEVAKIVNDSPFTEIPTGGLGSDAVTYVSSNLEVATVDANSGEVTINAVGATIITATLAADADNIETATYMLTVFPRTLDLGTFPGLPIILVNPVITAEGKTYYIFDADAGGIRHNDNSSSSGLDSIFNDGNDTVATQPEGNHDGSDDARSVNVGYILILPTIDELITLGADDAYNRLPDRLLTAVSGFLVQSADLQPDMTDHRVYRFFDGVILDGVILDNRDDNSRIGTLVQVRRTTGGPTFGIQSITDQNYNVNSPVNVTLPQAFGGTVPLEYDLESLPLWLTFNSDPAERTLTGTPTTTAGPVELTYTVTDDSDDPSATADLTFMVTVAKGLQTGFGFANTEVPKIVGSDRFTQTATGGSGTGAVTYTSDNTAVAIVNVNSGEVTIVAVGTGTAIITATIESDNNYNGATATYMLTVTPVPFITTWQIRPADDNSITIPVHAESRYRYTVDWGGDETDNTEIYTSSTMGATHIYTDPANHYLYGYHYRQISTYLF